jgi:hypothetical protein
VISNDAAARIGAAKDFPVRAGRDIPHENLILTDLAEIFQVLLARDPAIEVAVVVGADVDAAVAGGGRVPSTMRVLERQPMQKFAAPDVEHEQFRRLAADDGADECPAAGIVGEGGALKRHRRDLHAEVFKFSLLCRGGGGAKRRRNCGEADRCEDHGHDSGQGISSDGDSERNGISLRTEVC